jgi:glycine dehydrogenase subunit 1
MGNPTSFGGPYVGFFSMKIGEVRKSAGRIVGQTVDVDAERGFVLTLSTREQHIRREKASSNICSNQALNALAAGVYMAAMGKHGLKKAAELSYHKAHYAADLIDKLYQYAVKSDGPFFKEFVVQCPLPVAEINERLLDEWGIVGGYDLGAANFGADYPELKDHMLVCVTEMNSRAEIEALAVALADIASGAEEDLEGQDELSDIEEVA